MKQGLSLRVSQHLALTPQLQQSIRLLQLSTLELTQEIEQMLDDNPFLEKELEDLAPREDFGLAQENLAATPSDNDNENDTWDAPMDRVTEVRVDTASEAPDAPLDAAGVSSTYRRAHQYLPEMAGWATADRAAALGSKPDGVTMLAVGATLYAPPCRTVTPVICPDVPPVPTVHSAYA